MDAIFSRPEHDLQILGRMGRLAVRLAAGEREVQAAQSVRHRVFSEEFRNYGKWRAAESGLDLDRFDPFCDHLVVIDQSLGRPDHESIVGTYRLLRQEQAIAHCGFYSAGEFDLDSLLRRHPHRRFLELGRSCVVPEYRSRRTLELLWQGVWAYCSLFSTDAMFGCASFPGTDPASHANALSYLAHECLADPVWRVRALAEKMQPMDLLPRDRVNLRAALSSIPPMVKGYLRLGAQIGEGCVIDPEFGTVDVFIILPHEHISSRYLQHYGMEATRFRSE